MSTGFVPEVEQQLLGALLLGGEHRGVFTLIDETHFVEPVHREIFRAAKVAHEKYSNASIIVVVKLLPEAVKTQFKSATGTEIGAYLQGLADSTVFGSGNAPKAARNVLGQWGRLELARETAIVSEAARSTDADLVQLMRSLSATIELVGSQVRRGSRGKTRVQVATAISEAIADAEEAKAKGGSPGIATGLVDLDRMTGGLQLRDLILLGARPSMGKTSVGGSIALSAAKKGNGVGFFSMEMDNRKLGIRIASDLALRKGVRIPYENVINGSASADDLQFIRQCTDDVERLPLWLDDASGITIFELKAKVEAMMADAEEAGFALNLLIVDHLLKIMSSSRYAGNRVQEVAEITNGLKELAREYGIAVLLLSQLSRGVEGRDDKRPQLSDLRESGAIEQDADTVLFLYRDHYYLSRQKAKSVDDQIALDERTQECLHKAELDIAKQRNGRTQRVDLYVDMACAHFGNADRYGYGGMVAHRGAA